MKCVLFKCLYTSTFDALLINVFETHTVALVRMVQVL